MYTFASYGKEGKEKCEIIANYLNDTFVICKHNPLSVKDFGETDHFWEKHWCLQMNEEAKTYRNDIDKMRNSATDFWQGYLLGKDSK